MSQHLEQMNIGDTIDVRGPSGKLTYEGKGISHLFPSVTRTRRHIVRHLKFKIYYKIYILYARQNADNSTRRLCNRFRYSPHIS